MWNRIYLIALAVFLIPIIFFTYYSYDWLQSISAPQAAYDGYSFHSGIAWKLIWFASIVLLIIANVIFAKEKKPWALWATFIFFTVLVLVQGFWLDREGTRFWNDHFTPSITSMGIVVSLSLFIAAAAAIFLNQFVLLRLGDKLYPPATVESESDEATREDADIDAQK